MAGIAAAVGGLFGIVYIVAWRRGYAAGNHPRRRGTDR